MGRQGWRVSFRSGDFQEKRSRPQAVPDAPGDTEGLRRCARGEWCSKRTITFSDGERVILPALTPRPYCDLCQEHIAHCAGELPGFWSRLAAMIGDPLRATEVLVRVPFGPQILLREDVDAHLRFMAVILGGWAARVRAVPQLSLSAPQQPHDAPEGVAANAYILARHVNVLLALQPAWMTRTFPFPPARKGKPDLISQDLEDDFGDVEIVRVGVDYADLPVMTGGEDAGREILFMHYRARSLLLETNPPPEVLIPPCRQCTWRALRRAWAGADRDLYARCEHCGDELTAEEYDVNAKRWLAYHRASAVNAPVLADTPAA